MHGEITSPILVGTSHHPLAAAALGPTVALSIRGKGGETNNRSQKRGSNQWRNIYLKQHLEIGSLDWSFNLIAS
jgi:hypothetical protein